MPAGFDYHLACFSAGITDPATTTRDHRSRLQRIPLVIRLILNKDLASLFMSESRTNVQSGITDPGYNAAGASYQIARFVYEISFNT